MGGLTVAESGNAALSLAMSCSTWAGLSITNDPRSGSRRGLLDLSGFPVPRQEFVEALGWVIGQPLQNISQPGVRVDVIEFGRLDQGVDRRRTPPTRVRAGEGPIPPPDGNAPDCPFGRIVGQADAPVLKKARERRPALEQVVDRFRHLRLRRQLRSVLPQPRLKRGHKRSRALGPQPVQRIPINPLPGLSLTHISFG